MAEYVLMNSIRRLHGADGYQPLLGDISEVSGAKVGLLGLGASAPGSRAGIENDGRGCKILQPDKKAGA